ncbi:MAG: polynucleotide adenylyltransferase PcnB [Burkholderiaceae bacterium]|nr:polynucleotide adenylyltransferase PcnB [Burkholderiaceae bacterium]
MIKRLIDKLLGKPAQRIPLGKRVEVGVAELGIDPSLVDDRALKVVSTLKQAGHEAYVVGGAVRDLLVGRRPKDFDVATDATPEQVKQQFRRAFVIGRRFRLVHVVFGRGRDHEVIEVSTFRAYRDASEAEQVDGNERTSKSELSGKTHVVDASGRVLRDNVWGPQIEDAARRDFTINAMYYDPQARIVVDYHGGVQDAKKHLLRMIGDPATRYREDPVRVVRAVRFAAKLGFRIEAKTAAAMAEAIPLLANVPASRLFDEMIKLLQTGHARASVQALRQYGLHRGVFPVLQMVFDERSSEQRQRFIDLALADTDRRVEEGRAVAPSFLLACLLWHDVLTRWDELKRAGDAPIPALQQAVDAVFDARIGDVSGRGRLAADMREIWLMQPRFERRQTNSALALVAQPRFRAGYDFLRLRADAQEVDGDLADWWEDFSLGDTLEREALLQLARDADRTRRQPEAPAPPPAGDDAPRKRRRRRRRGSGAARQTTDGALDVGAGADPPVAGS